MLLYCKLPLNKKFYIVIFYYHVVHRWPKTLAGITAYHPCLQYSFNSIAFHNGAEDSKAWRKCNRTGRWDEENYSECPYSQEVTQVLHAFSQVMLWNPRLPFSGTESSQEISVQPQLWDSWTFNKMFYVKDSLFGNWSCSRSKCTAFIVFILIFFFSWCLESTWPLVMLAGSSVLHFSSFVFPSCFFTRKMLISLEVLYQSSISWSAFPHCHCP